MHGTGYEKDFHSQIVSFWLAKIQLIKNFLIFVCDRNNCKKMLGFRT